MNKILITILLIIIALLPSVILAEGVNPLDNLKQTGGEAYYDSADEGPGIDDPTIIVGNIIRIALGLVGTIFVILIIVSGYQWMTAGGNSETINKAKQRMINATIGLVLVLAAFSITTFILQKTFLTTGLYDG